MAEKVDILNTAISLLVKVALLASDLREESEGKTSSDCPPFLRRSVSPSRPSILQIDPGSGGPAGKQA